VTDTAGGAVWRIPRGGSAELWIQGPAPRRDRRAQRGGPLGANGIAFARSGAVFAAVNAQSTIVRVGEAGITTIADAEEGINGASAVAFGTRSDRRNLSVVNFGVFSPALLKIAVGVRGAPGQ
jgi:hypothetical protein